MGLSLFEEQALADEKKTPPPYVTGGCVEANHLGDADEMVGVREETAFQTVPGYESLERILRDAYEQASGGKGAERHANERPFDDQPIMQITRLLDGHPVAALAYQVVKKTIEAGRLYHIKGPDAAIRELHGAINYAAATVLRIQELGATQEARQ